MHTRNGGTVSLLGLNRVLAISLVLVRIGIVISNPGAFGQEEIARKVKTRVSPTYPELAKRMNITGVAKVQITVSANGSVKDAKIVGGHPLLANSALDAVKKWRFEPAAQETIGIVEFHFDPAQ
jgi:TonB family protein